MKKAKVLVDGTLAGYLVEERKGALYTFEYLSEYSGAPVSLTMPVEEKQFQFERFPPFFDGLLPEGWMLDALLRRSKIDADDLFSQLLVVGHDLVGNVTVEET